MHAPLDDSTRILIIGAGPCGLAAARELTRLGHDDWLIAEAADGPGGLASSVVDPAGFTWDLGGHVVFSHYGEFDSLLHEVMGDDILSHDRSSYIRFDDRWVPYPFQNNLRALPKDVAFECLSGLIDAPGGDPSMDFRKWMEATFGEGITTHFMLPYNFKVWATPADLMASNWIAERVSVVDWKRALRSLVMEEDDVAWGPNNAFVFPAEGGTGEIYRRLAMRMADRITYGRRLVGLDTQQRVARFADGSEEGFGAVISTIPLDVLIGTIDQKPDVVADAVPALVHNSVYMVGVGYETQLADARSWMYFPQDSAPFYRATNFAKYSPKNVPGGDVSRYCSYMTETSYSSHKPEQRRGLEERVEKGLRAAGVIAGQPPIASMHTVDIPYAYPVPTLDRDPALRAIQPWLMQNGVYSRGRFGAWKYELGNMDHAVKMGIDVARLIAKDEPEEIWCL